MDAFYPEWRTGDSTALDELCSLPPSPQRPRLWVGFWAAHKSVLCVVDPAVGSVVCRLSSWSVLLAGRDRRHGVRAGCRRVCVRMEYGGGGEGGGELEADFVSFFCLALKALPPAFWFSFLFHGIQFAQRATISKRRPCNHCCLPSTCTKLVHIPQSGKDVLHPCPSK